MAQKILFAGESSQTADKESSAKARALDQRGASPDEIWKQTGWWKAPHDGRWRYEIDDSKASVPSALARRLGTSKDNDVVAGTPRAGTPYFDEADMPTVLTHDEFYRAYPEARKARGGTSRSLGVIVTKGRESNAFTKPSIDQVPESERDPDTYEKEQYIEIVTPDGKKLGSVSLHELQHYIQNAEGFGRGTSPEAAGGFDAYQTSPGEMEARVVEWRQRMTAEQRRREPPWVTWNKVEQAFSKDRTRRPLPQDARQ